MKGNNEQCDSADGIWVSLDPDHEMMTIQMPVQRHIEIYNEAGKLVMYAGVSGLRHQVKVGGLANGYYLLKAGIYSTHFTICRLVIKAI